jgi:hypothetical protein
MRLGNEPMNKTTFSALQLKQLLIDIAEHTSHVCVRFRLLGEMWQTHMVRVISVSESRALVNDEIRNKLISIDLNFVMQFEIDNKFKGFQPYFHYEVVPDSDLRIEADLRF